MVWLLTRTDTDPANNNEPCMFIGVTSGGGNVAIGRNPQVCQVLLTNASISRTHAKLSVSANDQLFISDLSSTGTRVDGQKLPKKAQNVPLASNSTVIFGKSDAHFVVSHRKLVFCTTGSLGEQGENTLRDVATKLSATVVRKWSNSVTHLVTGRSVSSATTKLLCAIATGVPVVRLDWCTRMAEAITTQSAATTSASNMLPVERDFRPSTEVFESKIHSLSQQEPSLSQIPGGGDEIDISGGRQTLFARRIFVVAEHSNLVAVFQLAGGVVMHLADVIAEDDDDEMVGENSCRVFVFTKLTSVPQQVLDLAQRGKLDLVSQMAFIHALTTNTASLGVTAPPHPKAQTQAPPRPPRPTIASVSAALDCPEVSSHVGRSPPPEPPRGQKRTVMDVDTGKAPKIQQPRDVGVVNGDGSGSSGVSNGRSSRNKKAKTRDMDSDRAAEALATDNNNKNSNNSNNNNNYKNNDNDNNSNNNGQGKKAIIVDDRLMMPPPPVLSAHNPSDRASERTRRSITTAADESEDSQVIKRPKIEDTHNEYVGSDDITNSNAIEQNNSTPNAQLVDIMRNVERDVKPDIGGWISAPYVPSQPTPSTSESGAALRKRVKDENPTKLTVGLAMKEEEEDEQKQEEDLKAGHLASLFALVELKPSIVKRDGLVVASGAGGGASGGRGSRPDFRRFRKNFVIGVTSAPLSSSNSNNSPSNSSMSNRNAMAAPTGKAGPARARVVACDSGRAYVAGQAIFSRNKHGGNKNKNKKKPVKKKAKRKGRASDDESSSGEDLDLEDLSDMYSDSGDTAGDGGTSEDYDDQKMGGDRVRTAAEGEQAALQAFWGGDGFDDDDDDDDDEEEEEEEEDVAMSMGMGVRRGSAATMRGKKRNIASSSSSTSVSRAVADGVASSSMSRRRRFGGSRAGRARG